MPEINIGGVKFKTGGEVKVGGKVFKGDVVEVDSEIVSGTEVDPASIGIKKMEGGPKDPTTGLKVGSPEWKVALKAKIKAQQSEPKPGDVVIPGDVVGPQTIISEKSIHIQGDVVGRKKA